MPESRKRTGPQHPLRIAFRWCRIGFLLLVSACVAGVLWCNLFGFPPVVGSLVQKELRRRSIDLEFEKLRLKGFRQVVARDVRLKSITSAAGPHFEMREAEILFDYHQLLNGQLDITGLRIVSGNLVVPVDPVSDQSLSVTNITADVAFEAGDTVRIVSFSAETLGTKIRISGELRRLSKFRFASPGRKREPGAWQEQVSEILRVAEQLDFREQPELTVSILADGGKVASARVSVILRSGEATSQWGTFDSLRISSAIAPLASSNAVRGNFLSEISGFRTRVGLVDSLKLEGETMWSDDMKRLITNSVSLSLGTVDAKWFRFNGVSALLSSAQESAEGLIRSAVTFRTGPVETSGVSVRTNLLQAQLEHPLPFATPSVWLGQLFAGHPAEALHARASNTVSGEWRVESSGIKTARAEMESVRMIGTLASAPSSDSIDASFGFWRRLAPVQAPWKIFVTNITAGEIAIGSVQAEGNWNFPDLAVTHLAARLYGGYLEARAALNVSTRTVSATSKADFPYEKLAILLDEPVQRWLEQFSWDDPPRVESSAKFQLPGWTNSWASLEWDVARSLEIAGRFEGSGKFRGVPADQAASHFTFTNFVWKLPDLVITRPEGQAFVSYSGNVTNADFHLKVDSRIDPAVLKPLFPEDQQTAVSIVKFAQPPSLQAEAWGNWDDDTRLGVKAEIAATNFFVREQAFTDVRAGIVITNGLIHCSNVIVHRGAEELRAPYVRVDLPGEVMFVTNAISTIDPYIAMSLVGDDAYEAIDPYRFAVAPTVRVNGLVPLRHWSQADLRFEVAGSEFSFWKFHMPSLAGDVHWKADHIAFSNIVANFYGGNARWSGYFVIDHTDDSANFSFAGYTTNTEVKYLVADLTGKTNQMEGTLTGELIITSANSKNDRSWDGYGNAVIQDGFLWNVPIFGIFSPILDGIAPGLGSSRISSGEGNFAITNSVVYTRDMQVRAPAFRLSYKGQVDLDGKLDANVDAQIFRDVWVVGRLFSMALWPVSKAFEAKVSGTLDAPKTDLRFVPKFLLAPFRVLNAIGNAGQEKKRELDQSPLPADSPP